MKKLFLCALVLSLATALSASLAADTTLYMNVNGYTLNANRELQRFNAIQFTDDRVDRVFAEGEKLPEQAGLLIDGDGQTLIPGLIDAHGHILSYGLSLLRVDLVGTGTEQAAVQRVGGQTGGARL